MGRLILEHIKEKKKHKMISSDTKNHEITINCEKIEIKYKGNSFYTFDLNINKWSCLFSSFKDKKIVLIYYAKCDSVNMLRDQRRDPAGDIRANARFTSIKHQYLDIHYYAASLRRLGIPGCGGGRVAAAVRTK